MRGADAGTGRRNVRHDEGRVEPPREDRREVELAAPDVDHVGGKGPEPSRRALLAAAVEVHDGPLAVGLDEDERARAGARAAHHLRRVDPRLREPREDRAPLGVGPDGGDDRHRVPGEGERDRRVRRAAPDAPAPLAAVEVRPAAQRLSQRDDLVDGDGTDDDDASHGGRRLPLRARAGVASCEAVEKALRQAILRFTCASPKRRSP